MVKVFIMIRKIGRFAPAVGKVFHRVLDVQSFIEMQLCIRSSFLIASFGCTPLTLVGHNLQVALCAICIVIVNPAICPFPSMNLSYCI